jgi:hypothetical protein
MNAAEFRQCKTNFVSVKTFRPRSSLFRLVRHHCRVRGAVVEPGHQASARSPAPGRMGTLGELSSPARLGPVPSLMTDVGVCAALM